MEVRLTLSDPYKIPRRSVLIEQGVPVAPLDPGVIDKIQLVDETEMTVPANIEADGRNENGQIVWIRLTTVVDIAEGSKRTFKLTDSDYKRSVDSTLKTKESKKKIDIETPFFHLTAQNPGKLQVSTKSGTVIDGAIDFQLWPDARSIVGGGAGTSRLASFIPENWSIEERNDCRILLLLKGRVPKYAAYTNDPYDYDPDGAQFDCELELIITSFSPVIRYRWRIENHTVWQTYLERYTLKLPLAKGARLEAGEESDDGKYLDWVKLSTPGGMLGVTAGFIESLGPGAGINVESRINLGSLTIEQIQSFANGQIFEPHKFLSSKTDEGTGIDLVIGGVNPPHDGCMWAENPEVHRLFYVGMGRTFEGSLIIDGSQDLIQSELYPIYFELNPDYYSSVGVLPENGDPVDFGAYKEKVFAAAEWMLKKQWKGTLWWGEWWREYDVLRGQGVESTANANNPLAPLYHYWRTQDHRFLKCAKLSMEFVYDVQLSKRRGGLGSFFQCRRFLIDKMEWVHMRYQRIEGPIKAAHFFGDRRLRNRILKEIGQYADNLVCPNGAPGYGQGGPNGKRVPAGSDCTNFGETLGILYKETGEQRFLEMVKKMADWTIKDMKKWDWNKSVGNSYGWHFLMRGMLSTIKLTGKRKYIDWYLDMAKKNMTYPMEQILFVNWMNWLIVEAEKMSGETWLIRALKNNTEKLLSEQLPDGVLLSVCEYPWSKWPSIWHRLYDPKTVVAYVPVLSSRLAVLGIES